MKSIEIWQKTNPLVLQPVLKVQMGWGWLSLISDYNQFHTMHPVNTNFHDYRFTHRTVY